MCSTRRQAGRDRAADREPRCRPDGVYYTGDDVETGGLATWAVVKAQAAMLLGIELRDTDVTNVPLLATDAYGNFLPGANGFPRLVMSDSSLVEGNPPPRSAPSAPCAPGTPSSTTSPTRRRRTASADADSLVANNDGMPRHLRRRAAGRALHHGRRPRQREHRPDLGPPRLPFGAQPAGAAGPGRGPGDQRPRVPDRVAAPGHRTGHLPGHAGRDRRPAVERRARVPGGQVRHRDAVPAPRVRGVRPQGPAGGQHLRRLRGRHQPGDRRRVRPYGLPLRPLDADRDGRPHRRRRQPGRGWPASRWA